MILQQYLIYQFLFDSLNSLYLTLTVNVDAFCIYFCSTNNDFPFARLSSKSSMFSICFCMFCLSCFGHSWFSNVSCRVIFFLF